MAMPGHYQTGGYGQPGVQEQRPLMQGGYQDYPSNFQPGGYAQGGYGPTSSLSKMQTTTSMNLMFFTASCCIMLGAFIGGICLFFSFELVDFLEMCYLLAFGVILAILDTPFFKTIKMMGDLKMYIGKYINILTRVTGKGVTFLFLGTSLFSAMWDNLEGGFLLFLSVVLCFFPVVVGLATVVIGVMKSQKLNKARQSLEQGKLEQRYDQWAQTYRGPQGGLTPAEFNSLTIENGGYKWEDSDLKLIFNALVSNPIWRMNTPAQSNSSSNRTGAEEPKIPKEDLLNWVKGGIVWL